MARVKSIIKKVAIYSRKSRLDETDEALQRQLKFLIDKCIENQWEFDVYQEVGSSQSIDEKVRPELNKLLERIQEFHYDAVVVTDQDRLSRTTSGFAQIKEILTNYGVQVVTESKIYDYSTQEDDLMSDMQSIVAKQEYLNTKKRLVRGKRQSAKEGNWAGGKTPVGYSYDHKSKKLVPDENASIIKRIYDLYLSGYSSTEIERIFEVESILTPLGAKWNKARISAVLSNPVYKGTAIYGKTKVSKTERKPSGSPRQYKADISEQIIVENAHEPLVSEEIWEKVRLIREERATITPSARIGKVMFTRLIKCGLCGRTHSFQKSRGGKLRITSCQTRYYNEDGTYTICKNKGVNLDKFEIAFYKSLESHVLKLVFYLESIKQIRDGVQKNNIKNPLDEKTSIIDQIKKIESKIKKVQQGFIAEIFTEEQAQKDIKLLKAQKKHFEEKLEKLESKSINQKINELEIIITELKHLILGTSKLAPRDANKLLRSIIDYIIYVRTNEFNGDLDLQIKFKDMNEEAK